MCAVVSPEDVHLCGCDGDEVVPGEGGLHHLVTELQVLLGGAGKVQHLHSAVPVESGLNVPPLEFPTT